nr:hypothetical protein [Candidatus Freyarchaeota archaeon]
MKKVSRLMLIMSLTAFSAGLLIYLLGLIDGFFQTFATYIMYLETPRIFTLSQFLLFEIYPRLVLLFSNIPLSIVRLSPLTLIFIIFAFTAIVSISLKRIRVALLCSTSASLTASVQYLSLLPLVGGEPLGLVLRTPLFLPIIPPSFLILLSSKNLYLIILPAILFGSNTLILLIWTLQKKVDMLSVEPTISKYFKIIKSTGMDFLALAAPMFVFLLAGWFQTQILQAEVPQYPLLLTFARDYPSAMTFVSVFWIFYWPMYFLSWRTRNRALDRVAEQFIPILIRESKKQKPLIPLDSVKQLLELESIDKRWIRETLNRAATIADKKGALYFGVSGNYVYLKEPIASIVKEKLRERGEADINEIAKEIEADPKLLKNIYYRLRRERLLENVRIVKNMITPLRTAESP